MKHAQAGESHHRSPVKGRAATRSRDAQVGRGGAATPKFTDAGVTTGTPQPAGLPPERLRSFELMADTTLVLIRCGDVERPVLKVVARPDQVVIIIRSEQDEHLTLHRKADGTVMFTHWSPDKPRGAWDRARVEAARKLGWQNPDKHAHYYSHRPLFPAPIEGMDGHELVSRRIRLEAAPAQAKYARKPRIVVDAPAPEFMLSFHLSTPEQPYSAADAPHVATSFGDLYFRPNTES